MRLWSDGRALEQALYPEHLRRGTTCRSEHGNREEFLSLEVETERIRTPVLTRTRGHVTAERMPRRACRD
jgi:hypothetical protein